jgi:hypothetical protein
MAEILVGTREGLHILGDEPAPVELPGRSVTFLASARAEVLAIVDGAELWRRADRGWTHLTTTEDLRATCLAYTDRWLVGTSEAHLFEVVDGALDRLESFDQVAGRDDWYTPWGGPPDTRSFSEWDDDVYVNVHVGGIVRTDDGGATWSPTIDIDADVHQVTTTEGMVLAACAGGLATSTDRGASWTYRTDGLEHRYSRAVSVWNETVLVTASRGPRGGEAGVYRAPLAGGPFERCRTGLPEWFEDNIDSHCLDAPPEGPLAVFGTNDGHVYRSDDEGAAWQQITDGLPPIQRVLVLP